MMRTLEMLAILVFLWLALPAPVAAAPAPAPAPAPATERATSSHGDDDDLDDLAPGVLRPSTDRDAPVSGPAIAAVLAAAYQAAGLDHDPGGGWIRRARLAGLIPWVTVRTARDTSWQDDQPEVGHGTSVEVRATWRLDRLVFDGHELQVATLELARRRERRRLASRVIRSYFTWRRAAAAVAALDDERATIRLGEATAELDALTDGWFSGQLARSRPGSTEPRDRRAHPP
ncbi:MAG TPA: hypothetical protein VFK02_00965 [Kofleriaceae bacterium]|nr:hypothetical protein [Kofleriaceae bacterium]